MIKPRIFKLEGRWRCDRLGTTGFGESPKQAYQRYQSVLEESLVRYANMWSATVQSYGVIPDKPWPR